MSFRAPTIEQRFVLDHVADLPELAKHGRFAHASPDMVDAIVDGIGAFAEDIWAPLNRIGDTEGAGLENGVVRLPDGFQQAWAAYVEGGWGTLSSPPQAGGQGLPFALATAVIESLGAANMALTLCPILTMGAVEALEHHGSEAQRALYLPRLVTGEWTGTMNLTEPQAGSDVGALRTVAEPIESGPDAGLWSIRGTKIFITFGEHELARNIVHLVLARTPDAPPGTRGISLFVVPKFRLTEAGEPGPRNDLRCVSLEHKLGINASPTCVMSFGDNGQCVGELVGEIGGGMRAMFTMMNHARVNVGNQGVHIAERATQAALGYARGRVQSARAGGPREPVAIIEHPDVRRMLLRMKALTEGARALLYYAAGQIDRAALGLEGTQGRADLLVPLVKAWGTDIGVEVASLGVQVHGGMGYVEETGAAQHYRDARIAPIYEGTNGIQAADLVGRKLADGGAALRGLIADIRSDLADGQAGALPGLVDDLEQVLEALLKAGSDDRLAGSMPFLTMAAVATAGWQMSRQAHAAERLSAAGEGDPTFLKAKQVSARFFLERIVAEARGLAPAAGGGVEILYALSAEELAA